MAPTYKTQYSLIARAIDLGDESAWSELHQIYSKFIFYVLRKMSVPETDLDDVSQQVLLALMKGVKTYDLEKGRFRSWLRSLIKRQVYAYYRSAKKVELADQIMLSEGEEGTQAPAIDELIDNEWKMYVTDIAITHMRAKFRGQAIEVFELDLQGLSTDEIAEKTGLSKHSVYTLRMRMQKALAVAAKSIIEDIELS